MKKQSENIGIDRFKAFETSNLSSIYAGQGGVINNKSDKNDKKDEKDKNTEAPIVPNVGSLVGGSIPKP